MLAPDVTVEDFDVRDWTALGGLFSLAARASERPAEKAGGVVFVADPGRLHALFSTRRGRLDPGQIAWPVPIGVLASAVRARWVLGVRPEAIRLLVDRLGERLEQSKDPLAQPVLLLALLKELAVEGLVETFPRDLRKWGLPSERLGTRLLDAICPVGRSLMLGAFDAAEVETAVVLHRGRGGFDRLVGPGELRREMGLRSGAFARDARGLVRAAELSVGPLALGGFAETRTWRRLFSGASPGAWAGAVAAREIVFLPVAPALAIPLGVDVGRAALALARDWAARFGIGFRQAASGPLGSSLVTLLRELLDPEEPR